MKNILVFAFLGAVAVVFGMAIGHGWHGGRAVLAGPVDPQALQAELRAHWELSQKLINQKHDR